MANVDLSSLKFPGLSNTYVIPSEVAWVTYGTSTSAQIEAAYSSGKFVVCTMTGQNSEILMLPLVSRNSQTHHIFALSDGTGFVWADCDSDTWTDGENAIPLPQLIGTPQPLGTAAQGLSNEYSRADHVHAMPSASDVGAEPAITEVTVSTAGAVTQALDAGKIYHFTGALTSLTITLNAATGLAHYHFDFDCGSTAPTVTIPNTVTMPSGNSFDANKHYEVDILNNFGAVMAWATS